jgi:O-antigen/teichoic acid export membrane protein
VVTLALTSRWLGPEGRGVFAVVTTWVALFTTISYLSLGQVALYRASARRETEWLAPTLGSLLLLAVTLSVCGWAVLALLLFVWAGSPFGQVPPWLLLLGFLQLPFAMWEHYASALLMAIGRLDVYNRGQVVGHSAAALLVVALVAGLDGGVPGALVAALVGQATVATFGTRLLLRKARQPVAPDRRTLAELLSGGVRLHPTAVGAFLSSSVHLLILNYFLGPEPVGHYQLAWALVQAMAVLPAAASQVLYSHVSQLGADAAWPLQRRVVLRFGALMVVLGLGAAGLAPWIIPLLAGHAFAPAVPLFRVLLLTVPGMTLALLMAPQWIGRGLFTLTSALTLVVGALSVLASWILIPALGLAGALWASVLTYAVPVLGNGLMALWVERRSADDARS